MCHKIDKISDYTLSEYETKLNKSSNQTEMKKNNDKNVNESKKNTYEFKKMLKEMKKLSDEFIIGTLLWENLAFIARTVFKTSKH